VEIDKSTKKTIIRCAIYTRKSTTEGLDQEFSSLDAQRESCENYIASQKSEGWVLLPDDYDDGGFTGANMERPALKKLLDDIKDKKVDCVVVYKVDRLSRSLIDFTKLLELFEKLQVTFVSITQAFNTNTSMGRLTLNILLSFAQFEREIISERTKDKMGAARRKGRWTGGMIPLGYDLDREAHKLLVNEQEAKLMREIFELYIKEKSAQRVLEILKQRGCKTKQSISKRTGNKLGGKDFNLTSIHLLFKSLLYTGKIRFQGQVYKGMHDPIISDELFARVQEIQKENRVISVNPRTKNLRGLLTKLLYCKHCNRVMIYTYTRKHGKKRYAYYVCNSAIKYGYHTCPTKSVNAEEAEKTVMDCLAKIAKKPDEQKEKLELLQGNLRQELDILEKELQVVATKKNGLSKADQESLQECERQESELRVRKTKVEGQLITQEEFKNALVINTPVWETLFSEEKRRILSLLIKSIEYDVKAKTLSINFNPQGIKLLNDELEGK
jgi:site-specific DNA recombinase